MKSNDIKMKKSFVQIFMEGAYKGWEVSTKQMITSLILANVLIYMINVSGFINVLELVFTPVMSIFSLPGAAVAVLLAGFFSKPGGAAAAAAMFAQGALTATEVTILFPAVILMGALVGQYVRIVVVSGVEHTRHSLLFVACIFDAFLSMFVMNILLRVMGLM